MFKYCEVLVLLCALCLSGGRWGGGGLARPGAAGGGAAPPAGVAVVVASGTDERHAGWRAALTGAAGATSALHPQHGRPAAHHADAAHTWLGWLSRLLWQRRPHALPHARAPPESAVLELRGAVQTGQWLACVTVMMICACTGRGDSGDDPSGGAEWWLPDP